MKDCYSVLRRQILEDVLGEKVEEYENFNKCKLSVNKRQHRKLIPLWKFLLHLLSRDKKSTYIEWSVDRPLEFRIKDTASVAELWGSMKNKTDMTYEKLGRAMRYYYGKSIIEKVCGKRYSYRFILSRRTKKYISQFVSISGMKVEPIDSNCESPDYLNSDSASVGSAVGTSEEDEASISLFDAPSPARTTPPSPIKVKAIKSVVKSKLYTSSDTERGNSLQENLNRSPIIQKTKVCIIKRGNRLTSAFAPPKITKYQVKIKTEEVDTSDSTFDKNQICSDSAFDRNQFCNDTLTDGNQDTLVDEKKPTINLFCKDSANNDNNHFCEESIHNDRNEFYEESINNERNQFCEDSVSNDRKLFCDDSMHNDRNQFCKKNIDSLKREFQNDDIDFKCKKFRSSEEHDDSDMSSSSGSISSEDIDHEMAFDYLENDLNQNNLKQCDDTKKTNYQFIEKQQELKLNRQIDPFMGCDYVRVTDYDRSDTFDLSFYDLFEEYLF